MPFEREEKPLDDAELEVVVQVIRRGLKHGDQLEELEKKVANVAVLANEAGRRLKDANRIGQEICRKFERTIDARRPKPTTMLEATEILRWVDEKSKELRRLLE